MSLRSEVSGFSVQGSACRASYRTVSANTLIRSDSQAFIKPAGVLPGPWSVRRLGTKAERRERSELVPLVLFPSSFWPSKKGTATINEQRSTRCIPTRYRNRYQWILGLDIVPNFLNLKTVR